MPKFAIGIDLGTTNSALACTDLSSDRADDASAVVVDIAQAVAPGEIAVRPLLPSFLYLPHAQELAKDDLTLPWAQSPGFTIGELARKLGGVTPIRLVASAKSWLCHPGIDRRGPVLPLDAPADLQRLSPLEASTRYLAHLREAWDAAMPDAPFSEQQVAITVPASFDPAARELTAEAARAAGFEHLILLEEPQAALYAWLEQTHGRWRSELRVGDTVLVVDVGGGTADLSLITVREQKGNLELHRVAVGDHILLGGDNMDLALAHIVRNKLQAEGKRLDAWQLRALAHACRAAKETLLTDAKQRSVPVVVPSRGSKLVGGTLRSELTFDEVTRALLDGFFPKVDIDAQPELRTRTALMQMGLPYAQDTGITRHLASFLSRQVDAAGERKKGASFVHPTALLFNGGVFKSPILIERLVEVLNAWLAKEKAPQIRVLEGADPDLAVARGAAFYGFVRARGGARIRGGTAQAFYVGVESAVPSVPGVEPPLQALCIAPFGMEEGTDAELPPQELGLVVGELVRFRFFGSTVRREDAVGRVLEYWQPGELEELEAIEAKLPAAKQKPGEVVPVRLRAAVTEVGTLRLEAVPQSGGSPWKVEFNVRGEG